MKLAKLVSLATLAALPLACEPFVSAVTTTPPMRAAELDYSNSAIRISEGVAMAFECHDGGNYGPCYEFGAASENPSIASVYPAHLDARRWASRTPTSFVLAGIRAGKTAVTVRSGSWARTYDVTVEPATRPGSARPVAVDPKD